MNLRLSLLIGLFLLILNPMTTLAAQLGYNITANELETSGSKATCHVEGQWQMYGEDANLFSVTLAMFDDEDRKIGTARADLDKENQTFSVTGTARNVKKYRVQFNCRVRDGRARQTISNVLSDFYYTDY